MTTWPVRRLLAWVGLSATVGWPSPATGQTGAREEFLLPNPLFDPAIDASVALPTSAHPEVLKAWIEFLLAAASARARALNA